MSIWSSYDTGDTEPYLDFAGKQLNEQGHTYYATVDTLNEVKRGGFFDIASAAGLGVPLLRVIAGDGDQCHGEVYLDAEQVRVARDVMDAWLTAVTR